MKKNMEQWITHAKKHQKSYYFYEGKVLDLTKFMFVHPGGRQVLQRYCFKDITHILWDVFPHNKTQTLMALQKYIIGSISNKEEKKRFSQQGSSSSMEHINFNNNNRKSASFTRNDFLMNFKIKEQNKQDSEADFSKKLISSNTKTINIQKQSRAQSNEIISQELTKQGDRRNQISKRFFEIHVKSSQNNIKEQQQQQNITIKDENKLQIQHKVPILRINHLNSL